MGDDSVWFGSGFIYARINLNQYIELSKRKCMSADFFLSLAMV